MCIGSVFPAPPRPDDAMSINVISCSVAVIVLLSISCPSLAGKWMPVSNDEVVPDVEDYVLDYYGGKLDDDDAPATPPTRTGAIIRILQPCVRPSKKTTTLKFLCSSSSFFRYENEIIDTRDCVFRCSHRHHAPCVTPQTLTSCL